MRKLIACILSIAVLLTLCACAKTENAVTADTASPVTDSAGAAAGQAAAETPVQDTGKDAPASDTAPVPDNTPAPGNAPVPDNAPTPDNAPAPDNTPAPDDGLPGPGEIPGPEGTSPVGDTSQMTDSQFKAVYSARRLFLFQPMSRRAVMTSLRISQFSEEDAAFGADHCGADWNEQARLWAKNCVSKNACSYAKLLKDLQWSGDFTPEEARYGADNCGADWTAEAAEAARAYMQLVVMTWSQDQLINQLEADGFTHEQALNGTIQAGYADAA